MTSLTEVYDDDSEAFAGLTWAHLGVSLVGIGAVSVLAGIVIATTDVGRALGFGLYGARELAGVLAGLGLPAVFVGIFAVLPTARHIRAAAVIGASIAVLGVGLFRYAYPYKWIGATVPGPDLTLPVAAVYLLGTVITFWCLFVAVAEFKTRSDPGGSVKLKVSDDGTTRVVDVSDDDLRDRLGGVGLFGGTPDTGVETGTSREPDRDRARDRDRSRPSTVESTWTHPAQRGTEAASDGGAETRTLNDAVFVDSDAEPEPSLTDEYCGNCAHFDYVRTNAGVRPYCGFHDAFMDDMEACDEWEPNR